MKYSSQTILVFFYSIIRTNRQGWGAGVGAGCFGSLEPEQALEPLEKKPGAGAAWKKSQEPEPLEN